MLSLREICMFTRRQGILLTFMVLFVVALTSCNVTKFVPEDKDLLYKTKVQVVDDKHVSTSSLGSYLRQTQNAEVLGFWKLQLHVYNTAPKDTTTKSKKRLQRNAFRMGEAPVIYDDEQTAASMLQLKQAMFNQGYFNATVDTVKKVKDRKMWLTYLVTAHVPYTIRQYDVNLTQPDLLHYATARQSEIKEGMQFNASTLDSERARISTSMRSRGYYYFDKDMLAFEADSGYGTHEVEAKLKTQELYQGLPDSVKTKIYSKYRIASVRFDLDENLHIREKVLRRRCPIHEGDLYSERIVEQAYSNLNGLGPVKYVDIAFTDIGNNELSCTVTLSKNKMNTVSAEIEGTYSAGEWGVAGGAGYINRNLFRGAEQLSLNGKVNYIWQQNGGRALELKADAGLQWPNTLKVNLAYHFQRRPDEYTRHIFTGGLHYTVHKSRSKWYHHFNFVDISYVYLPWISDEFRTTFIDKSVALKYTYQDHFILGWSYNVTYSGKRTSNPDRSYIDFSAQVETAGNALYGLSKVAQLPSDTAGVYSIFNIPYSQYVKGDINFTFNQTIVPKHHLVYHIGIGVAVPYLNASAIPFERRYFSGGSNSLRGWQARTLGPGSYRALTTGTAYDKQAGDIRLDLNLEYRWRVWSIIELAAFTDAGNIWTIRDYEAQPGGAFTPDFYKQIAWSYGVGLRLDLTFLIFRVDFGVKLYDPSRINYDGKMWRTVPNGLGWKDDMTFHFAIGYPF
mgnify:CR=1 FL=1